MLCCVDRTDFHKRDAVKKKILMAFKKKKSEITGTFTILFGSAVSSGGGAAAAADSSWRSSRY